jgi:hypothetical protein
MRSLVNPRVSDLRPGDFVLVECACRHIWLATKTLLTTAGLPPSFLISTLPTRLRCPNCGGRGRATVSIKWSEIRNLP